MKADNCCDKCPQHWVAKSKLSSYCRIRYMLTTRDDTSKPLEWCPLPKGAQNENKSK